MGSIVAFEPQKKQLGVAVQSHSLCVGSSVPWIEPGVGAMVTQSRSDPSFGSQTLDLMRDGRTVDQVLRELLSNDPQSQTRQVAMVDAQGNVAVHTGKKCIEEAGHCQGIHYSVQANLMLNNTVWSAMAYAFENSRGDLAERIMTTLEAAESEGGDMRGQQSAVLLIVSSELSDNPFDNYIFNLRVDDNSKPLEELRRLLKISNIFRHRRAAVNILLNESLEQKKFSLAAQEYNKAVELMPNITDNPEVIFWYAVTLVCVNKVEESLPLFKQVFDKNPVWRKLIYRLVKAEFLPNDFQIIDRIVGV